jgi:hypothetical protein
MDSISTSIWQDFFGVSNETAFQTIVPVAIAVLIFVLGFLLEALRSWNKKRKDNNQKRKFVFSQIEVLIDEISKQKTSVDKFIEQLRIDKIINLELELRVGFNPKHLIEIDSNNLFNIIVLDFITKKKERLDQYNSLIKQLDLIDSFVDQLKLSFQYSLEHFSRYEDKWNDNIDVVGDLHDSWITKFLSNSMNPNSDPFLYNFNGYYSKWARTTEYRDMYVAEANLIDIILQQCRIHLPNQYADEILRPLLRCKDAIENHRNLRKIKITEYEKYSEQLIEIEQTMKEFLEFYEKGKQ